MSKKRGRPCLGPGKLRSPAKRALVEGGLTPTICSVYTNQDHNYLGFLHASGNLAGQMLVNRQIDRG